MDKIGYFGAVAILLTKKQEKDGTKISFFPCYFHSNSMFLCSMKFESETSGRRPIYRYNLRFKKGGNMATKDTTVKAAEKILIDNHSNFEEWSKSLHKLKPVKGSKTYTFNLSELSFYENLKVTTEVDYYNTICGSKLGSILMKFTFLTILVSFFISSDKFSEITVNQLLYSIGITLLAALIGKTIGKLHARWNLIQLSKSIEKRLNGIYTLELAF